MLEASIEWPANAPATIHSYYQITMTNVKYNHWTKDEDSLLKAAVQQYGKDWVKVSKLVPSRTNGQCLQRWSRSLKPGLNKGKWSISEDMQLLALVRAVGDGDDVDWVAVSDKLTTRTSKQIRERWFQHLSPHVTKLPFTEADDALLLELHSQIGNRWTEISSHTPGRTADAVKVRIRSLHTKRQRYPNQSNENIKSAQHALSLKRSRCGILPPTVDTVDCEQWEQVLDNLFPPKRQKMSDYTFEISDVDSILKDDYLESVLNELEAELSCLEKTGSGGMFLQGVENILSEVDSCPLV
jgi:hypothetical protein